MIRVIVAWLFILTGIVCHSESVHKAPVNQAPSIDAREIVKQMDRQRKEADKRAKDMKNAPPMWQMNLGPVPVIVVHEEWLPPQAGRGAVMKSSWTAVEGHPMLDMIALGDGTFRWVLRK